MGMILRRHAGADATKEEAKAPVVEEQKEAKEESEVEESPAEKRSRRRG